MVTIRNYEPKDAPDILEIINYNIVNSTALYDYTQRTLAQQEQLLEDKIMKGFPVLIAEIDQKVVGFGMYGEFRFREAYKFTIEHSVYVHQNAHGKGIGQALMSALINKAKQQGLHTMIGVIDAENQGSITFHEKFGFKVVGIIKESGFKFDRWLDSVFVQLILK